MSHVTLAWGDMWTFWKKSPAETQEDILAQLNLPELMQTASKKVRTEILEDAPPVVSASYEITTDKIQLEKRLALLLGNRR